MTPEWSSRYPDRDRLRAEADCLAACFLEQLLESIPESEIRGFYYKGSSKKAWESPLDYVPEVSDVDMHLWFHDDDAWHRYLDTVPQAMEVLKGVEARFRSRVPEPLHEPRPQLIVMNKMLADIADFVYSPRSTVTVSVRGGVPEGRLLRLGRHQAVRQRETRPRWRVGRTERARRDRQAGPIPVAGDARRDVSGVPGRAQGTACPGSRDGRRLEHEPDEDDGGHARQGPRRAG